MKDEGSSFIFHTSHFLLRDVALLRLYSLFTLQTSDFRLQTSHFILYPSFWLTADAKYRGVAV